jgi:chromosome segregation ATPase
MAEQTAVDIENEKVEKEKAIQLAEENRNRIEEKIIELRQKIAGLRIEIGTLEISNIKAKEIVSQLKMQRDELTRRFWRARDSGC